MNPGLDESPVTVGREQLSGVDAETRGNLLRSYVRGLCAEILPEWVADTADDEVVFFESIAAAEFKAVIERDLQLVVPLTELVEDPTIARVANLLAVALDESMSDGAPAAPAEVSAVVADVAARFEPFGLTDVQHAYWLGRAGMFELGGVSAHLYLEFTSTDFDPMRATEAFRSVISRHDMLRAVIRPDGRQQVLAEVPDFKVEFEDLRGVEPDEAQERVRAAGDRMSHEVRPADTWPLFGVLAQVLPDDSWRIHLSFDLLVADAGSIQLLLGDWVRLYADPDAELAPVGIGFRDYVQAAAELERSETYQRARTYWLDRLPSLPPAPELPLVAGSDGGGERDKAGTGRFVRREFLLERDRWQRLRQAATEAGVTPSVVIAAAYSEVLAAWAKSRRFTLNLTVGDRLPVHPDVNQIVGDFTSLILLEVDFRQPAAFLERARTVQRQLWQDLDHRAFTGVRVLRELARVHGTARTTMPVVFTSVLGHSIGDADASLPGLGSVTGAISQTPQIHLDHQIYERPDGLIVSWDAIDQLFPDGLLDAAFTAYRDVLHRLADDPRAWHAEDVLDRPRAPYESDDAVAEVPDGLLHQTIGAVADADPDRVAVVSGTRRLSYGELVSKARQVGRQLRVWGVRRGDLVAVCMDKGWEQVVGALGVLEAGAGYVPIDPSWPEQRVLDVCAQTRAQVVLTQQSVNGRLHWPAGVCVAAVDNEAMWSRASDGPLPAWAEPTDVAYVIFTSGSTGRPKGVVIDHRGAWNTVVDVNRRFALTAEDRVLAVSSLSFDLSVWDIFGPLSVGGAVVLPDPGTSRDPEHWASLGAAEQVTVWNSVPALFELFVEYLAAQPQAPDVPLRLALLSGDWIPLSLPDRARRVRPDISLVSLGGATEASIWSICYPIGAVDPSWASIPYGRPLANQTVHVLDEQLAPRPVWAVGELYIGGAGVAKGYWADPERTAERFPTHPVSFDYLYRTGDLGRYLPDGTIEFLGREDFQVKVGGFRIELGEIEAALLAHPAVTAAVATAIGDRRGAKQLAAYLVVEATDGDLPTGDEIQEYCRDKLPTYMVPTSVILLDDLPLTANGKVDRGALPDPRAQRVHTAPATPAEEILVSVWAALLGTDTVSTTDNLFELGADSLQALRAVADADARGLRLALRDIFVNPTIAEQATKVGAVETSDVALVEPDPAGRHEPFGLTDVQHAYWLGRSGLFELGGVSAHLYAEFTAPDFDLRRATGTFRRLVDRHEMLRAVVRADGRQQVRETVPDFTVDHEDLTGLDENTAEERIAAARARLSHEVRPADTWPLFGVLAQQRPGGAWHVHVSFDLLVADASSVQIMLDDWVRLYADPELAPAPPGLGFRDYVRTLTALESTTTYRRARDYWLERLESLPPAPPLPAVEQEQGSPTRFTRREFVLDPQRWQRLRAAAVAAGITPSTAVATGYTDVLAAWSGSEHFTLNMTIGDRWPVHPDVNSVIGDFTSVILLEVDRREPVGFTERARSVQRQLGSDLEHRAFSGVRVLRELARLYGVGRAAMPVVFTSVIGRAIGDDTGAVPGLGRIHGTITQTPQVSLDHQVYERADGLVVSWDAIDELYPSGMLDAAFAAYRDLLHRLSDDPDAWHEPLLVTPPDGVRLDAGRPARPVARRPRVEEQVHTAPATPTEEILAAVWADLLGLETVSTSGNLFELGADSLLALRAVTDADAHGLRLKLRDIFAHPTVAGQAGVAEAVVGSDAAAPVSGPSALTPNQRWFLSQDLPARHHWNDASFLLSLQQPFDLDVLQRALRHVLAHHDALRMRFHGSGDGWTGQIEPADEDAALPFSVHEFATLSGPKQKKAVTEVSDGLQRSLDLGEGPLLRVAYFDLGQRPHCLLLLAHWLVVDHYSSRVLLQDLLTCYEQYRDGADTAALPAKTTPLPTWAAGLADRADSAELAVQLPYWTQASRQDATPLRYDHTGGANTLQSLESVTLRIDHDVTEAVLRSVPRAYGTDIATVLCTALGRAVPVAGDGTRRLLVDLERHGRDIALPGLDISRTVGRFSTIAPVLVELDPDAPIADSLTAVGGQLAAVPDQGSGYGMLRYLSRHGPQLAAMPAAQIGLNYVGQVDEVFVRSDLLSVPRMSYGVQRSQVGTRFRALDVLGYVVGRRLTFTLGFSSNLHSTETIEKFTADFRAELEKMAVEAQDG
ncbi:MAG: amino acid adenylation domain-containing protein [Actinocatenispora sp.]